MGKLKPITGYVAATASSKVDEIELLWWTARKLKREVVAAWNARYPDCPWRKQKHLRIVRCVIASPKEE